MPVIFRRLEIVFGILGLFYMTGAPIALLTPEGGSADGAPAYRLLGVVLGLVSLVLMARIPDILDRLIRNYLLVLLLTALVLMSGFWSPDPGLAFRRSGALALTVVFAIYLAERFDHRKVFTLMLVTAVITCAASYVAIFAFPKFGVHQGGEALPGNLWVLFDDNQTIHAGSWRGLFDHKNDFGRFAALAGMFFLIALLTRERARWFYFAALVLAIVLIVQSRSSQAILLLLVPGGVLLLLTWMRTLDASGRGTALAFLLPAVVVLVLNWDLAYGSILVALGKDASLTGRTEIWGLVLRGLEGHYLFGGGYGTGMIQVRPALETELRAGEIDNAHNGYLGVLIDVGFVGLGLVVALFVGVAVRAMNRIFSVGLPELPLLALGFCTFTLFGNIVGSYLFDYNSLYSVMLVMMWGMLGGRSVRQQSGIAGQRPRAIPAGRVI